MAAPPSLNTGVAFQHDETGWKGKTVLRRVDKINRHSKIPLYQQLYEIIRAKIDSGDFSPGDMLPPESELIEQYEVSRATVRQVLDMLVNEGLIFRQRGRGTFVAHPTLEQGLTRIRSFTEDMEQRGLEPGTVVVFSGLVHASEAIAEKLEISPGDELARIARLRIADGDPMSYEESDLIHEYCPGILDGDYANYPLRFALNEKFGIRITRVKESIRAVGAEKEIAEWLQITPGAAVFKMERVGYTSESVPIEFLRIFYRGDRYVLYNELHS